MARENLPVVVSLTTLPSRISRIRPTLESLLSGQLAPDLVLVSTTTFCNLENCSYEIPDFLKDPEEFGGRVRHVECATDWGPGTKILGPLPHLPRDCILVIADDDIVYHEEFLRRIVDAQSMSENEAYSFYTYRQMGLTIGQGCDGLSVRSHQLAGLEEFASTFVAGTTLMYHDDVWISFYLAVNGVRLKQLPTPAAGKLIYEQAIRDDGLAQQTGNLKRALIVSTHLPRLLRDADVSASLKMRIALLAWYDGLLNFCHRVVRKVSARGQRQ